MSIIKVVCLVSKGHKSHLRPKSLFHSFGILSYKGTDPVNFTFGVLTVPEKISTRIHQFDQKEHKSELMHFQIADFSTVRLKIV